jgi:hypothetical protein
MKIEQATRDDILEVALGMRESDFAEFSALYPADNRHDLADQIADRFGPRKDVIVAKTDGAPVAIGAVVEARPNVLTLLFFANDRVTEIGPALTRFIVQRLFPPLIAAGVHRIEAVSLEGNDAAHRWIEALGLTREAPPFRGYGKNGEAYVQFSWVKDDVRKIGA